MGQLIETKQTASMVTKVLFTSLLVAIHTCTGQLVKKHNLPVLFQYEEPGHSVAVFRGAELRQAIAAGLVPGFGNLGGRTGKDLVDTSADDMAAAMAAADARARAAAAKAAADARAAEAARAGRARTSQLDSAKQACIQACMNLAGQCRNPFA